MDALGAPGDILVDCQDSMPPIAGPQSPLEWMEETIIQNQLGYNKYPEWQPQLSDGIWDKKIDNRSQEWDPHSLQIKAGASGVCG